MLAPRAIRRIVRLGFFAVAALAVGSVAAMIAIVELELKDSIDASLRDDVKDAADTLAVRWRQAKERLATEARVVADEPRLKAALTTVGIDRATVDDMADEIRQTTRWDLVALVGNGGEVRGQSGARSDAGLGKAEGIWRGDGLFLVGTAKVAFGSRVMATLLAGEKMSDERLAEAMRGTRAQAVLFVDKDVVASTIPKRPELAGVTGDEARVGGERFFVRVQPLDEPGVHALVLASADGAEKPLERIRAVLIVIAVAGILAIVLVAWAAARRAGRAVLDIERAAEADLLARFNTPS